MNNNKKRKHKKLDHPTGKKIKVASPLSLCVVRNELISIGQIAKKFNCERAVAEWYYDQAGRNKKQAVTLLRRAINLETELTSKKTCQICQVIIGQGDSVLGSKYCFNEKCKAEECQGPVCAKCVNRLEKCPWCRHPR